MRDVQDLRPYTQVILSLALFVEILFDEIPLNPYAP